MFDDLIDPDPPRPGLDTLANVSERARRLRRRREATRVMGLGAVAGLLVGSLAFVVDEDPEGQSEIAESIDAGKDATVDLGDIVTPTTLPDTATAGPGTETSTQSTASPVTSDSRPVEQPTITALQPTTTSSTSSTSSTTTTTTTTTSTTTTIPLPTEPVDYIAVGDSVMLGAAPALSQRGFVIDAVVSRQMIDMIPVFEQLRDQQLFGRAVVVHLGTNGPISQQTLDAFLATMDDVPNVILMTVKANRGWAADNNALLRAADLEGDNKTLLDWEARSTECPGECFYEDGIHLRPEGQQFYADLIADTLGI